MLDGCPAADLSGDNYTHAGTCDLVGDLDTIVMKALRKEPDRRYPGVEQLADSSVNIRLVAMTQPGKQWAVGRELRRRLKNRFDREGIEIPFPQRTLHLGDAEPLTSLLSAKSEESQTTRR